MALSLAEKKTIVAEVSEVAAKSISAAAADYRGLTVPQMTELRSKARQMGVELRVVRNTLARRAFQGTNFETMGPRLVGPMILGFSEEEPGAVARLFKDFGKSNEKFEVKALSVAGDFFEASKLDAVAALPSRKEAQARLAGMLMAPITQLARTIQEPYAGLVRAVDGLAKQKDQAS